MLKRIFAYSCTLLLACDLTGCSWLQKNNFVKKRRTEYLRSSAAAPLRVPAGMDSGAVGDDYIVPNAAAAAPKGPVGILPPDSLKDKLARGVADKNTLEAASKIADAKPTAATAKNTGPASAAAAEQQDIAAIGGDSNQLTLNQPAAQAWKTMGAAIKRAGYRIALQNEQTATYYILDVRATSQVVTKATPLYQLKLQPAAENGTVIYLLDEKGNAVPAHTAQPVLAHLSDALAGKGPSALSSMFAPVKRWFKEAF